MNWFGFQNGTLRPYLNILVNIVLDNQICKMIQHIDSVETVLLKYKIFNSNKLEKYQWKCQMWSVSGASTVSLNIEG